MRFCCRADELRKIIKDGTRLQKIEIRNKNNAAANYAARFALQKELPIALVHCCDVSGDTPLTLAAAHGRADVCTLLLEASADVDRGDKTGITALMRAAGGGFDETVEILLEFGARVDAADKVRRATALHRAAQSGRMAAAMILVAAGASLSAQERPTTSTAGLKAERFGETPLDLARTQQHWAVAEMLEDAEGVEGLHAIQEEVRSLPEKRRAEAEAAAARAKAEADEAQRAAEEEAARAEDPRAAGGGGGGGSAQATAEELAEASRQAEAAREAERASAERAQRLREAASRLGVLEPLRFAGYGDTVTVEYAVALCEGAGIESEADLAIVAEWVSEQLGKALHPACRPYLAAALQPALSPAAELLADSAWARLRLRLYHCRLPPWAYGCFDSPAGRVRRANEEQAAAERDARQAAEAAAAARRSKRLSQRQSVSGRRDFTR